MIGEAALIVAFTTVALRVCPFPAIRRVLDRASRRRASFVGSPSEEIHRIRWAVDRAAHRLPGSTCLISALAADTMLRRRGLPSVLRLGASSLRMGDGTLDAHAWVESGDIVVTGGSESRNAYVVFSPAAADPIDALCAVARGDDRSWRDLGPTPTAIADLCAQHEFVGVIVDAIRKSGQSSSWPTEIAEPLEAECRAAAAVEAVRRRELIVVLEALTEAGVSPILFKGAALAYDVYDTPASRPRSDVDLMIRQDDVARAGHVMTRLGYRTPAYCDGEILFRQIEWAKRDRFGVDHAFDLHWKISTQAVFADVLTYDDIAAEALTLSALGPNAVAAGHVHALLLACIHPAMHHRNDERLIWIYDVHLLASCLNKNEFDHFVTLALRTKVARVTAHQLRLACKRFGTMMPHGILDALSSPSAPEATADYLRRGRRWHHELTASMRALTDWRSRVRLAREILLPSGGYMLAAYGLPRVGPYTAMLPALYLHRAFNGLWKVLSGRK